MGVSVQSFMINHKPVWEKFSFYGCDKGVFVHELIETIKISMWNFKSSQTYLLY